MRLVAIFATDPAVYISAAVSPTIRPVASMIPDNIPGTALGSTTLNTVLSLPAPSPKLPSLYDFGTAISASSVVLMMTGSTMIDNVRAPDISDSLSPHAFVKNSIPKSPYTMEGIPVSVSAVILTTPTSLLPVFAYSTRYIAANIPIGPAIRSDNSVM